jgi:hypothetical protein
MLKRTTIRGGALVFTVAIAGGASRDSMPCEYTEYQCEDYDDWTSPPMCSEEGSGDPRDDCDTFLLFEGESYPDDFGVCCIASEASSWEDVGCPFSSQFPYHLYCAWENRYPPNE